MAMEVEHEKREISLGAKARVAGPFYARAESPASYEAFPRLLGMPCKVRACRVGEAGYNSADAWLSFSEPN